MLVCPPTGAQAAFPYSYFEVYQNPTGRMSENVRLCPFLFVLMREKLKKHTSSATIQHTIRYIFARQ